MAVLSTASVVPHKLLLSLKLRLSPPITPTRDHFSQNGMNKASYGLQVGSPGTHIGGGSEPSRCPTLVGTLVEAKAVVVARSRQRTVQFRRFRIKNSFFDFIRCGAKVEKKSVANMES